MLALAIVAVLAYAPPSGGLPQVRVQPVQVSQAVKRALRASGAQVLDGAIERARDQLARGWVEKRELEFFARALALVEEGRRALEHVELERAEARFGEAERLYLDQLSRPGAAQLASAALLGRGVAWCELGRLEEARRVFRLATALEPSALLTEASVRPDVAHVFAAAVADSGRTRAALTLSSAPPSAELFVDGSPVGVAPVQTMAAVGPHWVQARAPGRQLLSRVVDVPAAGLSTELILEPHPIVAALETLRGRPEAGGLRALAAETGVDAVIAVAAGVDAGQLTLVGQRSDRTGCATLAITVARATLDEAAEELVRRLGAARETCAPPESARSIVDADPIAHPRPRAAPRAARFYQRPWLWLGLFVASSAAVGAAIALTPQNFQTAVTANPRSFGAR